MPRLQETYESHGLNILVRTTIVQTGNLSVRGQLVERMFCKPEY
jgi:hypothetical protein